jgi:hypothetical protein
VRGAGGAVGHHQPTHFPGMCSRSRNGLMIRSARGRSRSHRHGCPGWVRAWAMPAAGRLLRKGEKLRQRHGKGSASADCRGGGADILAPTLPNLVALLREGGQVWEIPRVDYVPDVDGHLVEEQDFWISSTEAGFRAMSWSIRTYGLFTLRSGWSNHLTVLWWLLSPYECSTICCNSAYGSAEALGSSQSRPMVSTRVDGSSGSPQ